LSPPLCKWNLYPCYISHCLSIPHIITRVVCGVGTRIFEFRWFFSREIAKNKMSLSQGFFTHPLWCQKTILNKLNVKLGKSLWRQSQYKFCQPWTQMKDKSYTHFFKIPRPKHGENVQNINCQRILKESLRSSPQPYYILQYLFFTKDTSRFW
jgi:hypothetical protein